MTNEQRNAVAHPRHYNDHPSGVECIEIAEWLGFNLGNAFKYEWRRDLKHADRAEDQLKALWYVRRERQRRASGLNGSALVLVPEYAAALMAEVATTPGTNPMLLNVFNAAAGDMSLCVLEDCMLFVLRRDGVPVELH